MATARKRAAIGIRVHSGWGALVAVSKDAANLEVAERRRIAITDGSRGAFQPYHFARDMQLAAAQEHLDKCAADCERRARDAIGELLGELEARHYRVAGCGIILASGRALPPLEKILGSHPMLHTAEGEFFRNAFRRACEALDIPVSGFKQRDLKAAAKAAFGSAAPKIERQVAAMGRTVGSPWTSDQKDAALAAVIALAAKTKNARAG